MIGVLVIDDEPMARERILNLLADRSEIQVLGQCRNGVEAVAQIREKKPDLIFLDIQMPGLNGFEVLAQLDKTEVPEIVFVTAYDQYTLAAFATHALDYLLKPFDNDRFYEMLHYACQRLRQKKNSGLDRETIISLLEGAMTGQARQYLQRIPLRLGQKISFVEVADLLCLEAEGSYVRLFTQEASFLLRENLGKLEKELDPTVFMRVHRSTILRIEAIQELQHWSTHEWLAILKNGKKYIVSRNYKDKVKEILRL